LHPVILKKNVRFRGSLNSLRYFSEAGIGEKVAHIIRSSEITHETKVPQMRNPEIHGLFFFKEELCRETVMSEDEFVGIFGLLHGVVI